MAVRIEDLPPWAQQQAIHKMQAEARRKAGASLPVKEPEPEGAGKYHNRRTVRVLEDGTEVSFDSQKEARHFDQLLPRLRAGEIRDLKLQPQFTLQEAYTTPEGKRVRAIRYQADFSYEVPAAEEGVWRLVVEDVKSEATRTRVYEIKKKLLRERRGIEIQEV